MASQVLNDPEAHNCMIWAMTTFYDLEWSSRDGWEKEWRRELNKFSEARVKTKRICLLDNEIISFLTSSNTKLLSKIFEKPNTTLTSSERRFKNPTEYLQNISSLTNSCFLYDDNSAYQKLILERGFFGIVLSNQKKFLTSREVLNKLSGLTAEYVFDERLIEDLFDLHKQVCIDSNDLLQEISRVSSAECKAVLNKLGIKL